MKRPLLTDRRLIAAGNALAVLTLLATTPAYMVWRWLRSGRWAP